MIRIFQLIRLKFRRYMLIAQIETVEENIQTDRQRREILYNELRRTNSSIAMKETASNLLTQALRRKV